MLTGWRLRVSKLFCLPQRYVMAMMGFFCIMIAFMLRVCLNIAITQMVTSKPSNELHDPDTCIDNLETNNSGNSTSSHGEYDWDEETQGIILGSFYYGYAVTQIMCGYIIEKYGAKQPLGVGVGLTAVMTLLTPAVIKAGGNDPTGIIVLRALEGLAEGPTMPAMASMISRWVPKTERGTMAAVIFGGAQIGIILGSVISGFVMAESKDWPSVFYLFGALGVIWFIFWQLLVYSDPRTHPFISDKELEMLEKEIDKKSTKPIPWRAILTSMPILAILVAAIGHDWGYFTMITDLPKYMNDVLKFSIAKTGMLSALPYLVMWLSAFVYGAVCDWCIRRQYLSVRNARKIFTSIAAFGPASFVVAASYAGCDKFTAVAMFCIAMGTMAAYNCGLKINVIDLTTNYTGAAVAYINGIAAITGIITPYIVGYLTPNQTQEEWRLAFWIMFGVLSGTNIFFIIFARGEIQWWDDIEKNGYPVSWKRGNKDEVEIKDIETN